ncbi:hypothetical protein BGZ76_010275 [Entomortierella beljakovae]|nr:hypothetical protein BGZ76_010275 [Entomortierella beljakovae]
MFSGEPKFKNLVIHVDTGNTIGPKGLPLIYGNPDTLSLLRAKVTYESSQDLKAKSIEITFKAVIKTVFFAQDQVSRKYEGEQVFSSKTWELEVERPKPGWISKGSYGRQCSVLIEPSLPSSCNTHFGSMKYIFEARVKGAKGFGLTRTDWVVSQEVWVLNSSLPFSNDILMDNPTVISDEWKNVLPYSISIPTDTVYFGQVFPVTIHMGSFKPGSAYDGDQLIIMSAVFKLRESKTYRATFVKDTLEKSEKLMNISFNTGWPQKRGEWDRTINVSLPMAPEMSASFATKYFDVLHDLVVAIEFKTNKMAKPEKLQAQFTIQVTAPRIIPSMPSPPQYGDGAVHIESLLLLEPPPAFNPEEHLPSYTRHEPSTIPEGITVIRGRVRFRANYECKGEGIRYSFKGRSLCEFPDDDNQVRGEAKLIDREWFMNVKHSTKPHKLLPGQYEEHFEIQMPHNLPASSITQKAKVVYELEARLIREWSLDVVDTKTIWFSPTDLPSPPAFGYASQIMPSTTTHGSWKGILSCTMTLPSQPIYLGQEVPVRIQIGPALANTIHVGKSFAMLEPKIRLKQYTELASTSGNTVTKRYKDYIIDMKLTNWPKHQVPEYHDMVILKLPMMPVLAPSTDTSVYKIRHSINLLLDVVFSGHSGVMKMKVAANVICPRPPIGTSLAYVIPHPLVNEGKIEQTSTLVEMV